MFNRKEWFIGWKKKNAEKLKAQSRALYWKKRDLMKQQMKTYYQKTKDPNKYKAKWLRSMWGLTVAERDHYVNIRDSRCDICDNIAKLEIDHDHKTGKIRGFLCGKCNKGLGLLQDNLAILDGAMRYLQFQLLRQIDPKFLPLTAKRRSGS